MTSTKVDSLGEVKSTQTKHIWIIKDFRKLLGKVETITSPVFETKSGNTITQWKLYLKLVPKSHKDLRGSENVGVYIECLNRNDFHATVEFNLLIGDVTEKFDIKLGNNVMMNQKFGTPNFICQRSFDFFLLREGDEFQFICTITTEKSILAIEKQRHKELNEEKLRLEEFDEFEALLDNKEFSDIIFSFEGKEIHAHRIILAVKSSVFKEMFKNNDAELSKRVMKIENHDYETFYEILYHIYTGRTDFTCDAKKLLIAADEYNLRRLKKSCEDKLSSSLCMENIFQYLEFAHRNFADDLKQKALEFIVANAKEIIKSPSFEIFRDLESDIVREIFTAVVSKD